MNSASAKALSNKSGENINRRYAELHRLIDSGKATDLDWMELCRICAQLNNRDEARRCPERVQDPDSRFELEQFLVRRGLLDQATPKQSAPQRDLGNNFREEFSDALSFLFFEHMPIYIMAATLVFPVLMGISGLLFAGTGWVFSAVALAPALLVLGLVSAYNRQVLLEASKGVDDPPALPAPRPWLRKAGPALLDIAAVFGVFWLPGAACLHFDLFSLGLPLLLVGTALAPMALTLRQLRDDWKALHPGLLVAACRRAGKPYAIVLGLCLLGFAPALGAAIASAEASLYLRISFIAPLCVTPLLLACRLLGLLVYERREALGGLAADQTGHMQKDVTAGGADAICTFETRECDKRPERPVPKRTRPRSPQQQAAKDPDSVPAAQERPRESAPSS